MDLLILCPQWGSEHLPLEDFFIRVKEAGYDGIDTWMPENLKERKRFISLLDQYKLKMVSHQHQAKGTNIEAYCKSLEYYLSLSMDCNPILINSHSGRDYFSLHDQLKVIDTVDAFSVKHDIKIAHETHRGRIGFSPYNAMELFKYRPTMKITADFSHWTCVTESWLEHSPEIIAEAIKRTIHIHARVGYTQGPQIPDPRLPEWEDSIDFFLGIWKRIVQYQEAGGAPFFTLTTEFGPPPYMWTSLEDNSPVSSQWDINCYMKDLLKQTLI
ncbi:MAG: sugar phosphate isomerase/epimerase [Sphingobacteriia bacterium]|nr:MAG: sugar phosphate isomerase/epimerase [Sphingobacteriia bacterium]